QRGRRHAAGGRRGHEPQVVRVEVVDDADVGDGGVAGDGEGDAEGHLFADGGGVVRGEDLGDHHGGAEHRGALVVVGDGADGVLAGLEDQVVVVTALADVDLLVALRAFLGDGEVDAGEEL